MKKNIILVFLSLLILSGCATVKQQLPLFNVKESSNVASILRGSSDYNNGNFIHSQIVAINDINTTASWENDNFALTYDLPPGKYVLVINKTNSIIENYYSALYSSIKSSQKNTYKVTINLKAGRVYRVNTHSISGKCFEKICIESMNRNYKYVRAPNIAGAYPEWEGDIKVEPSKAKLIKSKSWPESKTD